MPDGAREEADSGPHTGSLLSGTDLIIVPITAGVLSVSVSELVRIDNDL